MHTLNSLFRFARARHGRVVAARWLLSLFMVFSFVSLATAAETHQHAAQAVHDCMLCSAAADQLGNSPVPPALVHHLVAELFYTLQAEAVPVQLPPSAALLPPACGPPSLSA